MVARFEVIASPPFTVAGSDADAGKHSQGWIWEIWSLHKMNFGWAWSLFIARLGTGCSLCDVCIIGWNVARLS